MKSVLRVILLGAGLSVLSPALLSAQDAPLNPPVTVLLVDSERLFRESAFGKRILEEQEAEIAVLTAENRKIAAELSEEERRLTEQRSAMAPEDFRKVADAFDLRVTEIRRIQDQKEVEIARRAEQGRLEFIGALGPVWENLMRQSGAQVIVEKRSAIAHLSALDVTEVALQSVNTILGDGAARQEDDQGGTDN